LRCHRSPASGVPTRHRWPPIWRQLQCAAGKFNPKTDLNDAAEIRGKVAESWWFAKARAGGVTLGQMGQMLVGGRTLGQLEQALAQLGDGGQVTPAFGLELM
jgi:hypothetical protein